MTPSRDVDRDWDVGDTKVIDLDDLGVAGTPYVPTMSSAASATVEEEYLTKPDYLDKAQAGNIVQLNPKTIERAILEGELPAFKLRGQVRIRRRDLEEWVEAHRIKVATELHDI